MEGCRLALQRYQIFCRFSQKSVRGVFCYNSHRLYGQKINIQNLGLLSVAPFHCHGIHRLYSSSSSKKPESSKIGDGIDAKQQKDPQIPVTPGESGSANDSQNGENKLSVFQRFKKTYKEHGKVLIFVEIATSIFWYGLFYTIVSSGVDVISLLEQMGFSETLIQPFRSSSLGDFVIAFLLYKLISPIRYAVTLGGTGYIIRWMRKRGKIPHVTQNTKLSTLYKDSREEIRTKRANFKERRRSRAKVKGKKKRGQK